MATFLLPSYTIFIISWVKEGGLSTIISPFKRAVNTSMTDNRPLCTKCKSRPRAFNYKKGDKTYYRKMCDKCIRLSKGKGVSSSASWQQSGYKKKAICEKCGFKSKHPAQMDVYHVDGNLKNNNFSNLKTICANCSRFKSTEELGWKQGSIVPDL